MRVFAALICLVCAQAASADCPADEWTVGCKIIGNSCACGRAVCKDEEYFTSRRACLEKLEESRMPAQSSVNNICHIQPCTRGLCIQTQQEPGFLCKCEGTGYYGQRCERACPTSLPRGYTVFPHECIVI